MEFGHVAASTDAPVILTLLSIVAAVFNAKYQVVLLRATC